jgi:hypothetical protein
MNRRRFLTSVPVLAGCGVVVAFCGRLFGAERPKVGLRRSKPWIDSCGVSDELMASWEAGPPPRAKE